MMRALLDGTLSVPVRGSFAVKLLLTLSQKHLPAHDQRGHHQNADYQTKRRDNRNVAEKRECFAYAWVVAGSSLGLTTLIYQRMNADR